MAGILVGVDTPHARDLVRGLLGNEGHQVRLARDGREVLHAYALECPDLLVLDVQLPDPGGLEVCRLLRAVDSQTPVLLLSPRCGEEEVAHALGTGADDFLVRPFGAREFAARVRALLRRAALPRRADAPDVAVFSLGASAGSFARIQGEVSSIYLFARRRRENTQSMASATRKESMHSFTFP